MEIQRFTTEDRELAKKAFKIRTLVFVKEQGVDPDIEYDIYENQCQHYLVTIDNIPVGAARWRKTTSGIKLERFAILPEYRKAGIGKKLLKRVMKDILPTSDDIYLHSQENTVRFYKQNGFEVEGEKFVEAGINHYLMRFNKKFASKK